MTNKITDTPWHTMQVDEVIGNLVTNVNTGLNLTEVEDRLRKYGHNQLEEKEGVSPIMLFLSQFNDFIVWVLIAAAIVSGFMGEWVDALAIIAIVIINAIIGFIQEYRAEKSLAALQKCQRLFQRFCETVKCIPYHPAILYLGILPCWRLGIMSQPMAGYVLLLA